MLGNWHVVEAHQVWADAPHPPGTPDTVEDVRALAPRDIRKGRVPFGAQAEVHLVVVPVCGEDAGDVWCLVTGGGRRGVAH